MVLDSTKETNSFDLPLVTTLDAPTFKVDFDGNIAFEDIQVSEDLKKLVITVSRDFVPEKDAFGRLTIRDRKSGQTASISLLIQQEKPLTVSPHTIRFYKSEVGEDYKATVFIRLGKVLTNNKSAVFAEAHIAGKKLGVATSRLSDRVARLQILLSSKALSEIYENVDSKAPLSIDWRIVAGIEQLTQRSPVHFFD